MKKLYVMIILCMLGMTALSQKYTYISAPKKVTNVYRHCDKFTYDSIIVKTEWIMVSLKYDRKGTKLTEKLYFSYKLENGKNQFIPLIAYPYDAGEIQSVEYIMVVAKKRPHNKRYISAYIKL